MAGQTIEELELKFWMLWTLSAAAVKTIYFPLFMETKTVHFEKKKFALTLICETCDCACVWFLSWSELVSQEIQKCSD